MTARPIGSRGHPTSSGRVHDERQVDAPAISRARRGVIRIVFDAVPRAEQARGGIGCALT